MVGAAVLQLRVTSPNSLLPQQTRPDSSIFGDHRKDDASTMKKNVIHMQLRHPPIHISTNPSDVNPEELRELFTSCNLSSLRFPNRGSTGCSACVEPLDISKLRLALRHSSIVVSVFCRLEDPPLSSDSGIVRSRRGGDYWGNILGKMLPVTPSDGRLIGFGRAITDHGLTASIYDVMVLPALRNMGIGSRIVKRIVRMLTSKEIYDIAALCSEEERPFFKACGFGDDILCSTTMMYTRKPPSYTSSDNIVKRAS